MRQERPLHLGVHVLARVVGRTAKRVRALEKTKWYEELESEWAGGNVRTCGQ